jgi:hypothetical protein
MDTGHLEMVHQLRHTQQRIQGQTGVMFGYSDMYTATRGVWHMSISA